MPWNTTEIQESIYVADSAKYSKNKLNIFGNMTQETRKGYNLLDISNIQTQEKYGVTITNNGDGTLTFNGTSTNNFGINTEIEPKTLLAGNYTKYMPKDTNIRTGLTISLGIAGSGAISETILQVGTGIATFEQYGVMSSIEYPSMPTVATGVQKIRICRKNLLKLNDTKFEEYNGEDITLDLADTELCKITDSDGNVVAQDRAVYRLQEDGTYKWQFKKNIEKIVLNGTENWQINQTGTDNWMYALNGFTDKKIKTYNLGNKFSVCNLFKANTIYTSNTEKGFFIDSNKDTFLSPQLRVRYGEEDTIENFKNYLVEHNMITYYILYKSEYTDCTVAQAEVLDKLYKLKLEKGINNIFVESENGVTTELQLEYMQDLQGKLNQLEAMIVASASEEVTE